MTHNINQQNKQINKKSNLNIKQAHIRVFLSTSQLIYFLYQYLNFFTYCIINLP